MKRNNGFTLIELLVVIVILTIVALMVTSIVIKTIDDAKRGTFKNYIYGIIKTSELNYARKTFKNNNNNVMKYIYQNGVESSPTGDDNLDYKGTKPQNGIIIINNQGQIALVLYNGKYCVTKDYSTDNLTLEKMGLEECLLKGPKEPIYVDASGANAPQLLGKMIPIYWEEDENGNYIERETVETDSNWYDYGNKKWANDKTKDGSYWVWIPRYAYKIMVGYGIQTDEGKVDVKFLPGIGNEPKEGDNTSIETKGYEIGEKDTSMHYFLHPAFKFGEKPIEGFWVAKFSPSKNNVAGNDEVKVVPNANMWRNVSVSEAFNLCRDMESKTNHYGWKEREVNIHLMKNIEWGAVAYLSKSQYGAVGKVWNNPHNDYQTGCSGDTEDKINCDTCEAYNTKNGVKASTTHTIYGVYDMRGGAWEYVMGNLLIDGVRQNGSADFFNLEGIEDKYMDVYTIYESNKYGEAIYETSSEGYGITSWDEATSNFINNTNPWFVRGGFFDYLNSGVFYFTNYVGVGLDFISFRPVMIRSMES